MERELEQQRARNEVAMLILEAAMVIGKTQSGADTSICEQVAYAHI